MTTMVSIASMVATPFWLQSVRAFSAPPLSARRLSSLARPAATIPVEGELKSPGSASQVGNDAFLNRRLMERAEKGPGVVSDSKLKIGIVGAGLAGMVAAMDLADAGHEVEIFELRPFVGGKVSSWLDKDGNHIEMGLHVFFGCYYNLFGIMRRTGSFEKLRIKEHVSTSDGSLPGEDLCA